MSKDTKKPDKTQPKQNKAKQTNKQTNKKKNPTKPEQTQPNQTRNWLIRLTLRLTQTTTNWLIEAYTHTDTHCNELVDTDLYSGRGTKNRPMKDTQTQSNKVCLFVCCLTSQQHASVSQRGICSKQFYVLPH